MELKKTILVVDDDVETAEMFAEMLALSGYATKISPLGAHAMGVIEETPPDAVVLDMMLPDVPGLAVLEFIRSREEWKKMAVVVVSASGLPGEVQAGMASGADCYLTKPVRFQDLKDAVRAGLQGTGIVI